MQLLPLLGWSVVETGVEPALGIVTQKDAKAKVREHFYFFSTIAGIAEVPGQMERNMLRIGCVQGCFETEGLVSAQYIR